jgi:hypothetical protein
MTWLPLKALLSVVVFKKEISDSYLIPQILSCFPHVICITLIPVSQYSQEDYIRSSKQRAYQSTRHIVSTVVYNYYYNYQHYNYFSPNLVALKKSSTVFCSITLCRRALPPGQVTDLVNPLARPQCRYLVGDFASSLVWGQVAR